MSTYDADIMERYRDHIAMEHAGEHTDGALAWIQACAAGVTSDAIRAKIGEQTVALAGHAAEAIAELRTIAALLDQMVDKQDTSNDKLDTIIDKLDALADVGEL